MKKRIILIGYDSYSGRFIKWYAEYYHGKKIDYLISMAADRSVDYSQEIYRMTLFDFDFRDVSDAVIWVVVPLTNEIERSIEARGYIRDQSYFCLFDVVYGDDTECNCEMNSGSSRGIQFLEWLEYKYDCDFVTAITSDKFEVAGEHGYSYRASTQKEIFPVLDKCHCIPDEGDAIFDFGCGKGAALISFLDYGFKKVGGVEYEPMIFEILKDNIEKLSIDHGMIEMFQKDAAQITEELDRYNYFYFFEPFDAYIMEKVLINIKESFYRNRRKINIILINPHNHKTIEDTGIFVLYSQFIVDTRQKVVNYYTTLLDDEI